MLHYCCFLALNWWYWQLGDRQNLWWTCRVKAVLRQSRANCKLLKVSAKNKKSCLVMRLFSCKKLINLFWHWKRSFVWLLGVKNVDVDLDNQVVRVLGSSPVKILTEALEQTGRKARLIGQGVPDGIVPILKLIVYLMLSVSTIESLWSIIFSHLWLCSQDDQNQLCLWLLYIMFSKVLNWENECKRGIISSYLMSFRFLQLHLLYFQCDVSNNFMCLTMLCRFPYICCCCGIQRARHFWCCSLGSSQYGIN